MSELLNGKYRILDSLGRGGMGFVYQAEDTTFDGRLVALKKMGEGHSASVEEIQETIENFRQEALFLAKLRHPNLPRIYDHFCDNGHWYLVMDFIEGETLSARVFGGIPFEKVLNISIQLCTVLGYLHKHQPPIIFHDLKPSNIMLTSDGHVYLIDFGIARLFELDRDDPRVFGTPGYMAPERFHRKRETPRSDIYSLGVTLHELLSGHSPVANTFAFAPLRLSLKLGNQPSAIELEKLVTQMVELDENNRPQDMFTIKQELRRIVTLRTLETMNSSPPNTQLVNPSPLLYLPPSVGFRDVNSPNHSINTVAWSPDGTRLALGGDQGKIQVWTWSLDRTYLTSGKGEEALLCVFIPPEIPPIAPSSEVFESKSQNDDQRVPLLQESLVSTSFTNRPLRKSLPAIAWSPDGKYIASSGENHAICVWNIFTGNILTIYTEHPDKVHALSWSPDGTHIASCSENGTVQIWTVNTGEKAYNHRRNPIARGIVSWSPDGAHIASAGRDGTVEVWEAITGDIVCTYGGHSNTVSKVIWSPNSQYLVSCGMDETIQIWDALTAQQRHILEGHTSIVGSLSFSKDGKLLASKSFDGSIFLWRTDNWATVVKLETDRYTVSTDLAFHPSAPIIASPIWDKVVRIWDLDVAGLLGLAEESLTVQYTNAKVVLVGDTSVGKTGLSLVLTGQTFIPTDSTHGRIVRVFDKQEIEVEVGHKEVRETLLWDLAGQPGYRLIHQLHMNEVAVALVVFDGRNESDPFAGMLYWVRALQAAQRLQRNMEGMKMLLVCARIDRGGKQVSQERIDALMQPLGFEGYFETSAKEGRNIPFLIDAVRHAIDWEMLPKVTSPHLFQRIKAFLIAEKNDGWLLPTLDDLYRAFLKTERKQNEIRDFFAQFETCIKLLNSAGLIQKLSFGNLILLQPELLDAYASALINVVRDEPDGLGDILEETVRAGNFSIPLDVRITNKEQEKLLLIAMVEDLLRNEIVLHEHGEDGSYLVFPSESRRENPDLPNPEEKPIILTFEGPVQNIYTTLAVRLSHSGQFQRKGLWKNAITYEAKIGGTCGIFLSDVDEGRGKLTLFFDKRASEETRFYFEEYIQAHLHRRAAPNSVKRQRIFICHVCDTSVPEEMVQKRRRRGFSSLLCPVCENSVSLLDHEERLVIVNPSLISKMENSADIQRELSAATSVIQGKMETGDFDVFLCYNTKDKPEVMKIGEQLKMLGILPWLDEWEQQPGTSWLRTLEQQIGQIKSAAIFVGMDKIGPWAQLEIEAFLREFVNRGCPVIPVLLPGVSDQKEDLLPIFLKGMKWVDFRTKDPNPMAQLFWGISGRKV